MTFMVAVLSYFGQSGGKSGGFFGKMVDGEEEW